MRFFVLVLIAFCVATCGAIEVSPINKRDQPFRVDHEAGERITMIFVAANGEWKTLPETHFDRHETHTTIAAPPGQYLITTGGSAITQVIEEGRPEPPDPDPSPDPEPDPDPEPEPEPDPDDDKIKAEWVVWIEENDDRAEHVDASLTMRDPGLTKTLQDMGIKTRIYDKDQDGASSFLRVVDELPAMVIMGADGSHRVFPAPTSVEEAESTIRGAIIR